LDLTPDKTVSRPHALIGLEDGQYWIEDPGSTRGTKIDDKPIKGLGRFPLTEKNGVTIGSTTLFVEPPEVIDDATISPIVQAKEPPLLGVAVATGAAASGPVVTAPLADGIEVPFAPGDV